jgi:hypothetical protein
MKKVPNHVPPPWSDDMEEALVEQSRAIQGKPASSPTSYRTGIAVSLTTIAILVAALLYFADWQ